MNKFIGERLISVTEPWGDNCDGDEMILEFESGRLYVRAGDHSSYGCPFIFLEEA